MRIILVCALFALTSSGTLAQTPSASQAVEDVTRTIRTVKFYPDKPACLSYSADEVNRDYVDVSVYEVHDATCGGDPGISHRRDSFRVRRATGEILYYDVGNDTYTPLAQEIAARAPALTQQDLQYTRYTNARFGFSIDVPQFVLAAQGEAANGDGQMFRSADGLATASTWGGWRSAETEARCNAESYLQEHKAPITYRMRKGGNSVASLAESGKVYYARVVLLKERCVGFLIEYPENQKKVFDAITARMAQSLRF